MEKRTEFNRSHIEVCRNCKAEGYVMESPYANGKTKCPVCHGSGLVRKTTVGTVIIEPYEKETRP